MFLARVLSQDTLHIIQDAYKTFPEEQNGSKLFKFRIDEV